MLTNVNIKIITKYNDIKRDNKESKIYIESKDYKNDITSDSNHCQRILYKTYVFLYFASYQYNNVVSNPCPAGGGGGLYVVHNLYVINECFFALKKL
jgi:hypothetical protein